MDGTQISDLTSLGVPDSGDLFVVVDVSDTTMGASGTDKKTVYSNVISGLATSGANSNITSLTGLTTPLSVAQGGSGSATLTTGSVLVGNGTSAVSLYTTSGSGTVVALTTSPTFVTPTLGVASATTINKVTITPPASAATLTIANNKTLTVSDSATIATNSVTLGSGAVITFPTVTDTLAVLGTAQTYTATETHKQIIYTNNPITASTNAATVPVTFKLNTVTNNSAATLTITMTTASAVDGQTSIVRILDFSGVAQTLVWVNTENSAVSVPATSNGSTTLFLTVGFMYNGATSKWRCLDYV